MCLLCSGQCVLSFCSVDLLVTEGKDSELFYQLYLQFVYVYAVLSFGLLVLNFSLIIFVELRDCLRRSIHSFVFFGLSIIYWLPI